MKERISGVLDHMNSGEDKNSRKRFFGKAVFVSLFLCAALLAWTARHTLLHRNEAESAAEKGEETVSSVPSDVPEESVSSEAEPVEESTAVEIGVPEETPTPKVYPDIVEDAEPPFEVDFEAMYRINPDIIGWLYVDAMPSIDYPILQSSDNDYYLHHSPEKETTIDGSIFADYLNYPDFADPNTLLYGHNMRSGAMFGSLKFLNNQEKYDADPYFWIITPQGSYRYKIFSMFYTQVNSDVYLLYSYNDDAFYEWLLLMQAQSEVENDVPLTPYDKVVFMSTCTSDSTKRFVVFGKCVSSEKPQELFNRETGRAWGDSGPPLPELPGGSDGVSLSEIGLHTPLDG